MKFLGQAKKFFKNLATEPEPKTQHFNVRCVSGHRVRGERTEGYQALRCPACGEGVFVLPRSPLPAPPVPERKAGARSARAAERMVEDWPVELTDAARVSVDLPGDHDVAEGAEIVWDDALPEPPRRPPPKPFQPGDESVDLGVAGPPGSSPDKPGRPPEVPHGGDHRVRQKRDSKRKRRPSDPGSLPSPHGAPKEALAEAGRAHRGNGQAEPVIEIKPASRMRTINRWLLVIVPLFVVATATWRYREHRKLEYPAIVERGLKEGISALDSAEFDKAYQLLSAAKSAVDGLGGDVDGAEEIRRAADEAGIFVNLITQDLGELLAEAGRTPPETWASRFDSVYKGRSIFVDSIVTAVPDGTASSRYELLLRVLPPGEATKRDGQPDLVGEIDLTGFKLFELVAPERGHRVIFGARLASFNYDATIGNGIWVVRLEPKSGVFITHTKALDSLGWRPESVLPPEGRELAP